MSVVDDIFKKHEQDTCEYCHGNASDLLARDAELGNKKMIVRIDGGFMSAVFGDQTLFRLVFYCPICGRDLRKKIKR